MRRPFEIAGHTIPPGSRRIIDIPLSVLSNHTPINLPVQVIHGRREGPTLFVSAAIHGDEVLGVEIVRRLLRSSAIRSIRGTLLCIPIVNTYGFISHSRYLPDRRDLNRSFPGSASGSLASQLADVFITEIVSRSDYGIDLHTGAVHRTNLPQIRADLEDQQTSLLANAFGAPVILGARLRDGSLRQCAQELGCTMLLFEAGEALRFNETAIRIGLRGIHRVMHHLGMLKLKPTKKPAVAPVIARSSYWVRAPAGGILGETMQLGREVAAGERVSLITDPFGQEVTPAIAKRAGIVIGATQLPVVNQGDALLHVAVVDDPAGAVSLLEDVDQDLEADGFGALPEVFE